MRVLSKTHQSSLNLKFFLKSTRPSLPLKKGLSKAHQSSLTLKGGSTAFPKPLFSWRRLAALGIVQTSLTLLSFAQPFPSGYRGCTNRPTRCSEPLRYKVGGPSEVYASSGAAVFCAGWDRMDTRHLALTSNERRE